MAGGIDPGTYVVLSVTDTGTGISEETQAHIFEPFFTTKAEGKGTGMGLAAVYGTARSHRGAVTFTSEVGKGSTFYLYLPFWGEGVTSAASPATTHNRGQGRILVIDDEEIVRQITTDLLRRLGYEVTGCSNGTEAVEFYRSMWRQIDIVLLDMIMPKLDGRDTFAALHRINPDVRAILMSGYSIDQSVQDTLKQGAAGFLQKPFSLADLSRKLSEAAGIEEAKA